MSVDAITIQIVRNKIASLVDEMHYHFYRSGYSTIIRESRDFSCVVLDRSGRLIVAPPMFFHAPVYRHLVGAILAEFGDTIAAGDVFVSNHPYEGGLPHVSDMAFVAPVFAEGAIVGFVGTIAHKADIGGTVPGSTSANATELYHEGLLIPPIRIVEQGRFLPDIERLILANSRQRELVRGDMQAQIAVTADGALRVAELAGRFGAGQLTGTFEAVLRVAGEQLSRAIAAAGKGRARAEGFIDNDGVEADRPIRLAVEVTFEEGIATFDFTGCDPQAKGPINLRPSMVEACVFYAILGALGPDIRFNDGMRDAVRLVLKPGTVVHARAPAPVSNYQMVNLRLVDVILDALAQFRPARAIAHSGASSALGIAWKHGRPNQSNMQYEIFGSAYGGGAGCDGATGTATHLSNLHITPIEILESEYPVRITRFGLVPDSGGRGRWRGGLSLEREYELLDDAVVIRRFDRALFPPRGLAGGEDGAPARFVLNPGSAAERQVTQSGRFEMAAGERFLIRTPGGGGYGAANERSAAAREADIAEGYVTAAGAAAPAAAAPAIRAGTDAGRGATGGGPQAASPAPQSAEL